MAHRDTTVLETRRLTLSQSSPADVADFVALEQDPEVMRYLNGGILVERERSNGNELFLLPTGTEAHVWTARRLDSHAFVGWFCLWPETKMLGELGYRLRRQDWGQGLASEGSAALIDWGFAECGFERIMAVTMTVNSASRRVLEKIGMKYVRKVDVDWPFPFPGSDEGEVEYAVTRTEWSETRA